MGLDVMDDTLIARLKTYLRKMWEAWSTVQDREDGVWRAETGEGLSGRERDAASTSCEVSTQKSATRSGDVQDLSELVRQRNAEHRRSQSRESE